MGVERYKLTTGRAPPEPASQARSSTLQPLKYRGGSNVSSNLADPLRLSSDTKVVGKAIVGPDGHTSSVAGKTRSPAALRLVLARLMLLLLHVLSLPEQSCFTLPWLVPSDQARTSGGTAPARGIAARNAHSYANHPFANMCAHSFDMFIGKPRVIGQRCNTRAHDLATGGRRCPHE